MSNTPAFQSTSQTLLQILQPGQGFYVPVYQRSYTWGADQIGRLFEDVHAGLNRAAASPGPPTFLGSAILFEGRGSVSPKVNAALPAQVLHVVDGQQRLTTLLIVLGQTRYLVTNALDEVERFAASAESDWIVGNLTMLASQLTECLWVNLPSAQAHFVRLPRLVRQATDVWGDRETNAIYNSDIAYYLNRLAAQELAGEEATSHAGRPHLRLAIENIDEQLSRVVDGSEEGSMLSDTAFVSNLDALNRLLPLVPADAPLAQAGISATLKSAIRIAAFAHFLLNQLILIDVRAPDEETAFSLFEPLNTTGQPLTPIETLRPLAVSAEGGLDSYIGSPSEVAFQSLGRYVPDELDTTERSKRVSSLLTSFALGQDGTKLPHSVLEQRRYLRNAFEAASSLGKQRVFVEGIAETATFLSDIWEDGDSPVITMGKPVDRLCLEVMRASNHAIVVPLLVRYYERAEIVNTAAAKRDFRAIVRASAAFWTIWRSSRTTTSGVDDVHRGLIKAGLAATSLPALARSSTTVLSLPSVSETQKAFRSLRSPAVGRLAWSRSWLDLVGDGAPVAGEVGRVGVELVGEGLEGSGDAGGVGGPEGDGDGAGGVGDGAGLVEEVAGDGPVFVGVGEVGVEGSGQVELGVVGEEPADHLQRSPVGARGGSDGVGVDVVRGDLGEDRFESGAGGGQVGSGGVEAGSEGGQVAVGGGEVVASGGRRGGDGLFDLGHGGLGGVNGGLGGGSGGVGDVGGVSGEVHVVVAQPVDAVVVLEVFEAVLYAPAVPQARREGGGRGGAVGGEDLQHHPVVLEDADLADRPDAVEGDGLVDHVEVAADPADVDP